MRLVAAGDAALIVEFEDRIDPELNARVVSLSNALASEHIIGIRDIVPTIRSLAVYFDPLVMDARWLSQRLRELSASPTQVTTERRSPIEIAVCYGGAFGPDLEDVARHGGLTTDEVITLHAERLYRAYMVGFLPGFAYLGVVDERIAAPRRATPRTAVAAGSVGIGGAQTGVYPRSSPGGWNIIGRTPLVMFEASRRRPSLVSAGDAVRFRAVDQTEFDRLSAESGSAT